MTPLLLLGVPFALVVPMCYVIVEAAHGYLGWNGKAYSNSMQEWFDRVSLPPIEFFQTLSVLTP